MKKLRLFEGKFAKGLAATMALFALGPQGCTPPFTHCTDTRTCPNDEEAGAGPDSGGSNSGGSNFGGSNSADKGGTTAMTGGVQGAHGGHAGIEDGSGGRSDVSSSGGTTNGLDDAGGEAGRELEGGAGRSSGGATDGGSTSTGGGGAGSGGKSSSTGGTGGGGTSSGGTSSGGAKNSGGSSGAGDTTQPTIVSISPSNLQKGVPSSATIKITFSETMNSDSVSSAFSLSSVTNDNLSFGWDVTGRVLTITPTHGLNYATGSTAAGTAPIKYVVSLSSGAKDLAGNPLAAFSSSFTTLRRITQTIASGTVGMYSDYAHSVNDTPSLCPAQDPVYVSTWRASVSSGTFYVFMPFDSGALGNVSDITMVENATLIATQSAPTGDFYSRHVVLAKKIQYHAIDKDIFSSLVTDNLGTFSSSAVAQPSISVLASLKSDLASGIRQHMFRLEPTGDQDYDTLNANFTCSGFSLKVVFLTP